MDRPKHRWFIIPGALLAVGVALLVQQWVSTTSEPFPGAATAPTNRVVEPQPDRVQPSTVEAAVQSPAATASASPTGGGLRGRIIDAATRRPVTEFEIRLTRVQRGQIRNQEDPITRTFQSGTGRFTWDDLAPDTWQVVVATRGYQQFDAGQLTIVAGKTTREIVMPLLRGYSVRGRVFERSTGAGIADAWISFRNPSAWRGAPGQGPYTKSKEDGSFVLEGIPGGDIVLTVSARDHAHRAVEIVVDDKTPPQEIALSVGGMIAGTVTTTSGAPVKGDIMLRAPDIGSFNKTDEMGRFSFKNMRPAKYSLSATTAAGSASQDIVLGPDEHKEDIVLVVGGGRSVRGTVRGLRPEQLKETFIALRPKSGSPHFSAEVDEQGAYAMNGVPPGRAQLSVHGADRQLDKTVDVPADQDIVVDIVFPPGSRLSGRVTQGGKPAADRTVWMAPADSKSLTMYRATTSEDGRYEIEGLPPGDYRIRAHEDISRSLTIAGDAVLNIDIPLVQLAGRVVEDGGDVPIVDANVHLAGGEPGTARVRGHKTTDDFGHFNLTGIEPGEVVLTIYKPGYELYREKIAYSSPITNKTIELRSDRGVEVTVHRAAGGGGEPVRGFWVTEDMEGTSEANYWIPLDREGVGSLPSALAGRTIRISSPNRKPIVIREWDGLSLDLTF